MSIRSFSVRLVTAAAALLATGSVLADGPRPPVDSSDIYRLGPRSGFAAGCIDPCRCPVGLSEDLRGTFRLTRDAAAGGGHAIDDVLWLVTDLSGEELRVTGSGSLYLGTARMHMSLWLSLDGAEPVLYEGSAPAEAFPHLPFDLEIPGAECRTTWFRIDAAPVPPDRIRPFALNAGAGHAFGCMGGGCLCPVMFQMMVGGFEMVPLGRHAGVNELAMVRVRWNLIPIGPDPVAGDPVSGVGIYRVRGRAHQMFGEFVIGDSRPTWFDSGRQGGASPPRIGITMYDGEDLCPGQALKVIAAPAPDPVP